MEEGEEKEKRFFLVLLNLKQLDLENECCIWGDRSGAALAVRKIGRDGHLTAARPS